MVEFKKRVIKANPSDPIITAKAKNVSTAKSTGTTGSRYKKKYSKKKNVGASYFVKFILYIAFFATIFAIIWFVVLYAKYIKPLPPVDQLETMDIPEASIIYDSEWNELYTFYGEEKRSYVNYEHISQNMINAIVAWEDQNFFENKWVDLYRMWWAIVNYITWKEENIKWTSTISQQLIRNTLIWNERKIERKIKEIYLSYKMNTKLSKTKIMELYLNKISFWSNAYGIEQAAKTFFWKSSKDLDILESSILASLPKWPTFYSPYRHYNRTVGAPYSYNIENPEEVTNIITQKDRVINATWIETLRNLIVALKWKRVNHKELVLCGIIEENYKTSINLDNDGCKIFKYSDLLWVLNNFIIKWETTHIEYQTWRKDYILWAMLQENYITFDEYKEALLSSIWFEFKAYVENIKYPHFVFYVKDFLVAKYGQDLIEQWGLKIFTSLEPQLQDKAEEIVKAQIVQNSAAYGANNAALISIDNRTWNIVTMVWWWDYYDTENKWNVNITTSALQPWSSFKPFVYALAIDKNPIGTKTPVYDVKTTFPGSPSYTPSNFDGKFKGKMTLTAALNQSRNIPAIKMYYLAWGQSSIVDFVNIIGGKSLKAGQYWPSLSLGTGLMTPLDMAISYSTFANMGKKKDITPIRKIEDSKWNIIEENTSETNSWEQVIDASLAYIMNFMLSDTTARPTFWNNFLALSDRKVAAKTWTSTFQYKENGKEFKFPRNLWTAWYTPQYTTVVWSWNTDWKPLNSKWNGLEWAGPVFKKFMEYIHTWEEIQNWSQPEWVKQANISSLSWFLPSKSTQSWYIISSLFKNVPNKYDNSFTAVQYDALCQWAVTEKTPEWAIKTWVFIALNSLKPDLPSWENPVQAWWKDGGFSAIAGDNEWNIITSVWPACIERVNYSDSNIELWTSLKNWDVVSPWSNSIEIGYRNINPIRQIELYVNGVLAQTIDTELSSEWVVRPSFYVLANATSIQLRVSAIDTLYYAQDKTVSLNIEKDTLAPSISIINPSDSSISIYERDSFNLRATINESSNLRTVNIYLDGTILASWLTAKDIVYPINANGNLTPWTYNITIEAIDQAFNKGTKNVRVKVLEGTNTPTNIEEDAETPPEESEVTVDKIIDWSLESEQE